MDFSRQCHPYYCCITFIVAVVNSWFHHNVWLHTILLKKFVTSLCKLQKCGGLLFLNSLNLASFDELDCTGQEFTCIICLTDHSTKIHHKTYKKQAFSHYNFIPVCVNLPYKALSSLPLGAKQNVAHHLMCNSSVILINVTPSL